MTGTTCDTSNAGPPAKREAPNALWQAYFASRSLEARTALLLAYRPIVTTEVQRLPGTLRSCWADDDLEGFGMLGLLDAISLWQFEGSFEDDAVSCVRGAIGGELVRLDWLPRRLRSLVVCFNASSDEVRAQLGRTPEVLEVLEQVRRDEGPECATTLTALFTPRLVHLDEGVVCGIGTDVVELTEDFTGDLEQADTSSAPLRGQVPGGAVRGIGPAELHLLVGMDGYQLATMLGVSESCVNDVAMVAQDLLTEILEAD